MDLAVGIIVALCGIFIGIILFIVNNILRSLDFLKEDVKLIRQEVDKIPKVPAFISSNLFLVALAREAKFWGKLSIQRTDKVLIANKIATEYIQEHDKIIVDSGTTVDQIPPLLNQNQRQVTVHTNNLLAAISVVPPTERFNCFLLPGKIDPIYGATYNIEDIEGSLRRIESEQIILSATAISFEEGPIVSAVDIPNRSFKKELVRKALHDRRNPRLIIAVDWTKFREVDKDKFNAVIDIADWRSVKATNRFVLITTNPPNSLQTPDAIKAREEIKAFFKNMEEGGMKVEIC